MTRLQGAYLVAVAICAIVAVVVFVELGRTNERLDKEINRTCEIARGVIDVNTTNRASQNQAAERSLVARTKSLRSEEALLRIFRANKVQTKGLFDYLEDQIELDKSVIEANHDSLIAGRRIIDRLEELRLGTGC